MRLISERDIAEAELSLREVYSIVEEGFRLHGEGLCENPPKQGVHTRPKCFMHAMPAYLPTVDLAGTKLVSVYPTNVGRGLDATTGIVVMMDPDTGLSTDILDAKWITNTRTAMVSMVASKWLSSKERPRFGIVGATGASGRSHIEALSEIYPGCEVLVNSRSLQRCTDLVQEYDSKVNLRLEVELNQEALTKECDVLIVCTSKLVRPIFKADWLQRGQNVLNVHALGWPSDIGEHVTVSTDDRRQVLDSTNGLTSKYPGLSPAFELGEVVAGKHPGRTSEEEVIFSFNYGLAIFDVLVGDYILRSL